MLLLLLVVVCRSPARRRPRWLAKLTAAVRYGRVPVLCWCARSSARRRRRCVSSNVGVLPPRVPAKVVSSQHASAFAIDTYTSDYFGIRGASPTGTKEQRKNYTSSRKPGPPEIFGCEIEGNLSSKPQNPKHTAKATLAQT